MGAGVLGRLPGGLTCRLLEALSLSRSRMCTRQSCETDTHTSPTVSHQSARQRSQHSRRLCTCLIKADAPVHDGPSEQCRPAWCGEGAAQRRLAANEFHCGWLRERRGGAALLEWMQIRRHTGTQGHCQHSPGRSARALISFAISHEFKRNMLRSPMPRVSLDHQQAETVTPLPPPFFAAGNTPQHVHHATRGRRASAMCQGAVECQI
jgi:hypothetical protein